MNSGGLTGQTTIGAVDWNPIVCLGSAFSIPGLKSIGILLLTGAGITAYVRFHDKFSSKDYDERGFTRSKYGTYGTASWMKDKELKEILEIKPPPQADGIILGEKNGSVVCLPKDTRLNRHIAVFGASGTRKSRGVIRPALFTILKRGESAVITDPKAELYNDTAELFRKNGYEVKVFNLVDPRHGDSWNCMSDLNGDRQRTQPDRIRSEAASGIQTGVEFGNGSSVGIKIEKANRRSTLLLCDNGNQHRNHRVHTAHLTGIQIFDLLAMQQHRLLEGIKARHPIWAKGTILLDFLWRPQTGDHRAIRCIPFLFGDLVHGIEIDGIRTGCLLFQQFAAGIQWTTATCTKERRSDHDAVDLASCKFTRHLEVLLYKLFLGAICTTA